MCFKHERGACPQGLNFSLLWLIGLDYEDYFRKKLSFSNKIIILKCPICIETSEKIY